MQTDDLPPLPHPVSLFRRFSPQGYEDHPAFSSDQVHQYARDHAAALQAENDKLLADAERWRWIEENAHSTGGGHGFTLSVFVPHDMEDWGCAIDAARTAITGDTKS